MPKRSSILWAAAILTAVAPDVCFWIASMLPGAEGGHGFAWMSPGWCGGREIDFQLQQLLRPVWVFPLLWFGSAPLITLAWGGRLLSIRTGRPRLGRILARSVVTVMIVRYLSSPLLLLLDASTDPGCVDTWGPPELVIRSIVIDLCHLVPAVLVLLTIRTPGLPRRGRLARTWVAVSLVITIALGTVADTAPGKVSDLQALDCARSSDGSLSGLDGPEKGFLCTIRDDAFDRGVPELADMPDRELLAYGHQLCNLAVRNGGDIEAPSVSKAIDDAGGRSLAAALRDLCPKVEEEKQRTMQAEYDAYLAATENNCASHPRHRPKIKPVRQVRTALYTEFWNINAWDEENEGDEVDTVVAELVGSGPGALSIWAADESGHACVTGEAYRRRPPLETRGWEQVVEVGYETAEGTLIIRDSNGEQLPDLAAGGPGNYRVRVHIRGRKAAIQNFEAPGATVQLLIMVFPGGEKKPVIYRNYPS